MNKRTSIFLILCILVSGGYGQIQPQQNTIAEERIHVNASSATVLQWFRWIEREKRITLSYNPSQINLNKIRRIEHPRDMTVEELLEEILKGYRIRTISPATDKLLIHIVRPETFCLSGTVSETGSDERLYGAAILLENSSDGKRYTLSDENGTFRFLIPEGHYKMSINYMGYQPYEQSIYIGRDCRLFPKLNPLFFELDEVTVKYPINKEMNWMN